MLCNPARFVKKEIAKHPGYLIDMTPVVSKFKPGVQSVIKPILKESPILQQVLMRLTPQEIISCEMFLPADMAESRVIYEIIEHCYPDLCQLFDDYASSSDINCVELVVDMIVAEADHYVRQRLITLHGHDIENYVIDRWIGQNTALFIHYNDRFFFDQLQTTQSTKPLSHGKQNILLYR